MTKGGPAVEYRRGAEELEGVRAAYESEVPGVTVSVGQNIIDHHHHVQGWHGIHTQIGTAADVMIVQSDIVPTLPGMDDCIGADELGPLIHKILACALHHASCFDETVIHMGDSESIHQNRGHDLIVRLLHGRGLSTFQ